MRCLPCGKVERQRDHKANTAYIVGWNLLLDSRWIHYRATAYTRVRAKATAPFFEYTKNFKRNQSSTKPRTDLALFSYWNRLAWTPNHARHLIEWCSLDYVTIFNKNGIERILLTVALAQTYKGQSSQNIWIAPATLERNHKPILQLILSFGI